MFQQQNNLVPPWSEELVPEEHRDTPFDDLPNAYKVRINRIVTPSE